MEKKIENLKVEIEKDFNSSIYDVDKLEELRIKYMGKKGLIIELLKELKNVANEDKKYYGEEINLIKDSVLKKIESKKVELKERVYDTMINNSKLIDLTLPENSNIGSLHPITIVQKELEDIFISMGFTVEDGNEIETEYNNFEAVNVPKFHPARDMQDTYWLENGEVLKTQTSAAQNRIMKKYKGTLKAIFPGRCFRNEEVDASHDNTFFQMEGMVIDENISISNLIFFMKKLLSEIFKKDVEVRLRPGFFPFVEPGFELDIKCPYCDGAGCKVCKHGGWIELCPCGMIHPKVLEMGNIDPNKYSGFAFGLGLSRLSMMKFQINDLRVLNSMDLRALKQLNIK